MRSKSRFGKKQLNLITVSIYVAAVIFVMISAHIIAVRFPDSARPVALLTSLIVFAFCATVSSLLFVRHKQHSLRQKENLENIMQQINAMVILWSTDFGYIKVNDEFIRTTGYTAEDLFDPEIRKRVLPAEAFASNVRAIMNNRDEEFKIECRSGETICTVWNTSLMDTFAVSAKISETIMMSIGANLTESSSMKSALVAYPERLRDSEKRYELSMELSEIGLLLREPGSQRFYVSERLCSMLGISSDNGYVEGSSLRKLFHPKDRIIFDMFATGMKSSSEGLLSNEIHSVDFRAMSADGKYHWYNFRYRSLTDGEALSLGGAMMDITGDKEKDLMIEKLAYVDEVTGIYNRNKFMQIGNELLEASRSNEFEDYWVIVIDIDSFHIINDTCGYTNGNRLLKEVGSVLLSNIASGDCAARIGGDNFAMIVYATTDESLPERLIERITKDISEIGKQRLETQNITCSAGYCLMSDGEADDFAHVLDRAEFALSLSDGARSRITRFDNSAHDKIIAGNELEKSLLRAVEEKELVLYYQPKINLGNGSVIGMEALIRWIKPDGTVVPPNEFIPVAESSMLITRISRFVLHEACRQNKRWQEMGLAPVTVSINLTAIDFYQTNVTETISHVLEETGLPPQYLDVELTESLALKDIDHAVMQMKEIKALGVKLSMDDFGTGYSSLSYIQILPITVLKLDRSFIMYLEEDEISREIVSAVIRIAKSKHIETVAEGIETSAQAEILRRSGCDHAQGYFFGKPMPADEFEEFLRTRQSNALPAASRKGM